MFNSLKKIIPGAKSQILPKSSNLFILSKFNFGAKKEEEEYHKFKFDRVSYNQELNSEERSK